MLAKPHSRAFSVGKIFGAIAVATFVVVALSGCATVEDPDDPGFNKPAVTGVINGEISTLGGYRDAVEKENRRANRDGPRWNDGFSDEF